MATSRNRTPLSRERILQAALRHVDEAGVESLTMRKLGDALGFEAMSLYNHVANKADVLDGILDLVLAESQPPAPGADWAASVRASAVSVHDALRRHPWSCSLLMSPKHARPERVRYMDQLLGTLREAGFSAEATYTAYHVLDAHIFGFSLWETSHTYSAEEASDLAKRFAHTFNAHEHPYLHEHAQQHSSEGSHRGVSAFELGLDLILAGLESIR